MEEVSVPERWHQRQFCFAIGSDCFRLRFSLFMSFRVEFYGYSSFWYFLISSYPPIELDQFVLLGGSNGLVIPWSTTLALVDAYSILLNYVPRQPKIMWVVIIGDWVLSFLSLAAACSTAGVIDLLLDTGQPYCPVKLCRRYQMSAATAFLSWFLSFASSLFNLWLLPSL
ncbi:hypothetical protein JRO89_XS08G0172400 [Xanthoceras sorbifolium]|uniref:CASP-like protein n=1 Tax=Xanthoceras sorbifolium TaxID=99658 RepID=A0ABQ8HQ75_9ROSI|nr:hypothetical protein JRO89_XS08G0172400 [Xanthoceras sorbifolium]